MIFFAKDYQEQILASVTDFLLKIGGNLTYMAVFLAVYFKIKNQ
jgi:hypothetical protein